MANEEVMKLEHVDPSVNYFLKKGQLQKETKKREQAGPLVSVIITTFNRKDLLNRALESVQIQSYPNVEIVVIDDQSTDPSTIKVLKQWTKQSQYPFSYSINEKNSGPSISRKNGYKKAKGEYLVFMDDDDYFVNVHAFAAAIDLFNRHPELAFVSGDSLLEHNNTGTIEYKPLNTHGYLKNTEYLPDFQIRMDKPRSTFSTVFSREKLEESCAFEMEMFNDSSIYLRALLSGDAYISEDVWGVYFLHDENISKSINCKFIVDNMEEKFKVHQLMLNDGYKDKFWIVDQYHLTINYFFNGNNTENLEDLIQWMNRVEDKEVQRRLKRVFYKERLKNRVKQLIRR